MVKKNNKSKNMPKDVKNVEEVKMLKNSRNVQKKM